MLLLLSGATARGDDETQNLPLCVADFGTMPESWRPSVNLQQSLNADPWSEAETKDASSAVRTGLQELNDYFSDRPAAIAALKGDAVESLIDASYAASNMPDFRNAARDSARRILAQVLTPYESRAPGTAGCGEFSSLLQLTVDAHALLTVEDARNQAMVALTNAAYRTCGSLAQAIGGNYRVTLAGESLSIDEAWDLVMWSILFIDAQLIPGLELPTEARDIAPALWRRLGRYPLVAASAYSDGAGNETFYNTAYLATHIAYLPTGYGRHPIYSSDAPWLYRFLRENFYAVLAMGELDLTAEFVDLFREYGCTEDNDRQLRDGTRHVLKLFHSAQDRWLAYREPNEPADTGDYNIVHKAWTGMSAVRARIPEPAEPGTYGGVVRQWLTPAP